MQMDDGENQDVGAIDSVENAVREPLQDCPSHIPVDGLELVGIVGNPA